MKDLNLKTETVQLLEEDTGKKLLALMSAIIFLDMTPKASNQSKNKEGDCIKLKVFCKANNPQN